MPSPHGIIVITEQSFKKLPYSVRHSGLSGYDRVQALLRGLLCEGVYWRRSMRGIIAAGY